MVYREDGVPVLPAQLPVTAAVAEVPLPTGFMATARAAGPTAPDTTKDEAYAKMLQEEDDEEARQLRLQKWCDAAADDNRADRDLFGDEDDEWNLDTDDFDNLMSGTCNEGADDEDAPIRISHSARVRRRRIQQQVFGDEDEDDEMWDFNGTEWVKVSTSALITELGTYGLPRCIKTEHAPATTNDDVFMPLSALELNVGATCEFRPACP